MTTAAFFPLFSCCMYAIGVCMYRTCMYIRSIKQFVLFERNTRRRLSVSKTPVWDLIVSFSFTTLLLLDTNPHIYTYTPRIIRHSPDSPMCANPSSLFEYTSLPIQSPRPSSNRRRQRRPPIYAPSSPTAPTHPAHGPKHLPHRHQPHRPRLQRRQRLRGIPQHALARRSDGALDFHLLLEV